MSEPAGVRREYRGVSDGEPTSSHASRLTPHALLTSHALRLTPVVALLLALLSVLVAPAGAAPPGGAADEQYAARVRADVRAVLASPDYRWERPGRSIVQRVGDRIVAALEQLGEWLRRLIPSRPARRPVSAGAGQVVFWLILATLVVGMAYLLAYLVRHAGVRPRRSRPKRHAPDVTAVADPEGEAASEPDRWLEAARRYAAAGDLSSAYRAAFTAVLLRLDRAGAIHFDRARTNGEYLRALRARPELLRLVRPLAAEFDAHTYGGRVVSPRDYEGCLRVYEHVAPGAPAA